MHTVPDLSVSVRLTKKLPKTLYDKVIQQHLRYAASNNLSVAEDKSILYEQVAQSEALNSYIDKSKSIPPYLHLFTLFMHIVTVI